MQGNNKYWHKQPAARPGRNADKSAVVSSRGPAIRVEEGPRPGAHLRHKTPQAQRPLMTQAGAVKKHYEESKFVDYLATT